MDVGVDCSPDKGGPRLRRSLVQGREAMVEPRKSEQPGRGTSEPQPVHRVRVPAFLVEENEIGLGDVVRRATYALGVKSPCGGCARRAQALNRWMSFHR
jgi:hypothetical protein